MGDEPKARTMESERRLDEAASHQYGVFTRDQAVRAGLSDSTIKTKLANGSWIRLAPATYAVRSAPAKWERQLAAALLSHPGSIVAGSSAGLLHEFPGFSKGRPAIVIPRGSNARSPIARVMRSNRFEQITRTRIRGFEVSSGADTILQVARELSVESIERLVDFALARGTVTVEELSKVVDTASGVPGVTKLRSVVAFRSAHAYQPPTSELERLLYRVLDHPDLPPYQRQAPLRFKRMSATVDAFIPSWKTIVEGDGRRWHQRQADMAADRTRDNEAVAAGFVIVRLMWSDLRDRPAECLDVLLRTGAVRRPA